MINQKLWLNDHSWLIGCNKIFVPICLYCSNAQNWVSFILMKIIEIVVT